MSYCRRTLLSLLLVPLMIVPLYAQVPQSQEARIASAAVLLEAGRLIEARTLLREALEIEPENLTVLRNLGRIASELRDWGEARSRLNQVLKQDQNDIVSLYHMGISYRETGKFKAFLLRRRDWGRAERYFQRAVTLDSSYRDLLYQYGILEQYRSHFERAISLGEGQMKYKPSLSAALVGLHRFYDFYLELEDQNRVRTWLRNHDSPRAALYLAESYRRHDLTQRADSMLSALLSGLPPGLSPVPVHLALARARLQSGYPERAQHQYNQAVNSISNENDVQLMFEFVKYVLTDEELSSYSDMQTEAGQIQFFHTLWVSRDPMPAAQINHRLIEHINRTIHAEKHYRFFGFRSWVNNPDKLHYLEFPRVFDLNDKYNDKGLVYIRHGEPDDRAFDVGEGIPENESWLYLPTGGRKKKMIFHFMQTEHSTGGNWRLTAVIPAYMAESRLDWDNIFHRMYMASGLERPSLEMEMAAMSRTDVEIGLNSDSHRWGDQIDPIYFPFYVSTFRASGGLTRTEVYYSLAIGDIWSEEKQIDPEGMISFGFSVHDPQWREIVRTRRTVPVRTIANLTDSIGFWPGQFVFDALPNRFSMSLYARLIGETKLGGYKFKYTTIGYETAQLSLSGIELASVIDRQDGGGDMVKNGLRVVPNPSLIYNKKEPVHIYFEIYHLPIIPGHSLSYEIEYTFKLLEKKRSGLFGKIAGLFSSGQSTTSNRVERSSRTSQSVEYLAVDLGKNDTGRYELSVTVTVPERGIETSKKREFILR